MILAFTLNMPRNSACNGKWSGQEKIYVVTKSFTSRKDLPNAAKMVATGSYHYDFGDGWAARIDVTEITSSAAASLRKRSSGFCGYEWMIDSIVRHGKILNSTQQKAAEARSNGQAE